MSQCLPLHPFIHLIIFLRGWLTNERELRKVIRKFLKLCKKAFSLQSLFQTFQKRLENKFVFEQLEEGFWRVANPARSCGCQKWIVLIGWHGHPGINISIQQDLAECHVIKWTELRWHIFKKVEHHIFLVLV